MNFDPATTKLQTLVVRSNDGDGTPVDWSTQIQINEREYDKAYIQLVNVSMRLLTKGPFPTTTTESKLILNVESNLGQSIYDSNGRQSFLGCFTYGRNGKYDATNNADVIDHGDSHIENITNPIIELPRIPNGRFQFQLTDYEGTAIPYITTNANAINGGTQKLQQTALVFQLYLVKSPHIKSQVML